MKIEPIIGQEIDIKNEFGVSGEDQKNDEKDSDGSGDLNGGGMLSQKFLEYSHDIESIFTTSNLCDLSYLCIVCRFRFSIFYIQDDNVGSADFNLIWDNDYRFNRTLKSMGQVLCLDFEKNAKTFITGTQCGWVCVWDLNDRVLKHRVRVKNPLID